VSDDADFGRLMERVRAGDPRAFAELLNRHGETVRAAVRKRLNDRLRPQYDSLDFVQEVWAAVLALPPDRCRFDGPQALAAFLTRVAENKVVDVARRRFDTRKSDVNREQPLDPVGGPDPGPTPSQVAVAEERWASLSRRLNAGERAVLERLREGYTHDEIAGMLGVSRSTVNRIVRRLKDLCGV
jgi:RNA polymerase sigma-70 factor (ECF subfamily)